jgi:hypothetical protein
LQLPLASFEIRLLNNGHVDCQKSFGFIELSIAYLILFSVASDPALTDDLKRFRNEALKHLVNLIALS